jgi:hypothetical protein
MAGEEAVAENATTETVPEVTTAQEPTSISDVIETADPQGWYYRANDENGENGIKGIGEKPDFLKDKYNSVEAQAKAYNDLEGKFGSFTGAPEEYELNVGEELTEKGFSIEKDDPMFEEAVTVAKDMGMNQEGLDKFVDLYGKIRILEQEQLNDYNKEQLAELGSDADIQIKDMVDWAKVNLGDEYMEGFKTLPYTADGVRVLQAMIAKTGQAPMNPDQPAQAGIYTEEEIKAEQFKLDQYGNRLMSSSPEHRRKVEEMIRLSTRK